MSNPPSSTLSLPGSSCVTCRVTGSATFAGVAAYLLYVRQTAISVPHSRLLAVLSLASASAAVIRWRAE